MQPFPFLGALLFLIPLLGFGAEQGSPLEPDLLHLADKLAGQIAKCKKVHARPLVIERVTQSAEKSPRFSSALEDALEKKGLRVMSPASAETDRYLNLAAEVITKEQSEGTKRSFRYFARAVLTPSEGHEPTCKSQTSFVKKE